MKLLAILKIALVASTVASCRTNEAETLGGVSIGAYSYPGMPDVEGAEYAPCETRCDVDDPIAEWSAIVDAQRELQQRAHVALWWKPSGYSRFGMCRRALSDRGVGLAPADDVARYATDDGRAHARRECAHQARGLCALQKCARGEALQFDENNRLIVPATTKPRPVAHLSLGAVDVDGRLAPTSVERVLRTRRAPLAYR
jgi:hypothetical protein